MITVRIGSNGGYIVGDGPIPGGLNPDQFYKMFMAKIMAAKMAGLVELGITQQEIDAAIAEEQAKFDQAETCRYRNNTRVDRIFDEMMGNPVQQIEQIQEHLQVEDHRSRNGLYDE